MDRKSNINKQQQQQQQDISIKICIFSTYWVASYTQADFSMWLLNLLFGCSELRLTLIVHRQEERKTRKVKKCFVFFNTKRKKAQEAHTRVKTHDTSKDKKRLLFSFAGRQKNNNNNQNTYFYSRNTHRCYLFNWQWVKAWMFCTHVHIYWVVVYNIYTQFP